MRFEQRIEVQADVATVWDFLWEVERLAKCLPGCQEVQVVEPEQRYQAVVEERIGPFRGRFEVDVNVQERETERLVRLTATGKDKKLSASTRGNLEVKLEGLNSGGTGLAITAEIQVMGKIASLGQPIIKRKAQETVDLFAQALAVELKSEPVGGND